MDERDRTLRGEWLELFCFMSSSARGLDLNDRVAAHEQGVLDDEFLKKEKEKIAEKKLVIVVDREAFVEFLDELVMDFTRELKREDL